MADEDIDAAYNWLKSQSSVQVANDWFNGITAMIESLSAFPERCPLAPEGRELGVNVRQCLYGNRRHAYRILFQILKDEKAVRILRVHHGARQFLQYDELNLN